MTYEHDTQNKQLDWKPVLELDTRCTDDVQPNGRVRESAMRRALDRSQRCLRKYKLGQRSARDP